MTKFKIHCEWIFLTKSSHLYIHQRQKNNKFPIFGVRCITHSYQLYWKAFTQHGSQVGTEKHEEKTHYILLDEQMYLRSTYLEFYLIFEYLSL